MGLLTGKRFLITGVMSKKSIAYGIAKIFHQEGAECAFSYVGEKFKDRVTKIVDEFDPKAIVPLDVAHDSQINALKSRLETVWPDGMDGFVHAIAFAPADQLEGSFLDNISREGFQIAHDISAYSFCAMGRVLKPLMQGRDGSMLTLSYLGAEKAVVNYNTMGLAKASLEAAVRYMAQSAGVDGIRVNGISAGPVRTLAASGIKGFRKMLDYTAQTAPLQRNITTEDVGKSAAFLCSDFASGVTGEILHVDCGYSTIGVPSLEDNK